MFFSIIVPAYNMKSYISVCLDSLLNQNSDNYEIIVVDDGSTDGTLDEIKKYEHVSNIKVVAKNSNTGLSDTRNVGLQMAQGEYVILVDSDDYISSNCLRELQDKILELNLPDVILMGHYLEKDCKTQLRYTCYGQKNKVYSRDEYLVHELRNRNLSIPAAFTIYKKGFLDRNNLRFGVGLLHEDELWTPSVLLSADTVGVIDSAYYHYVIREGSITQKKDKTKNALDLIKICNELSLKTESVTNKKLYRLLRNHISMRYMKAMSMGRLYRKAYKREVDRLFPLRHAVLFKDRIKAMIFAINFKLYCIAEKLVR